ncbi:MAG TPA: methyltransferase domain-containing protein [Candidatus Hydrogenedentes bacterium]|nr:methyltransferase domain-containing protein [Candidatus Hydrogenedentota bacterium]
MGLLTNTVKRQRLRVVTPYVRGDVLDVGCGPALALEACRDRIGSYTGIEHTDERVAGLRRRFPDHTFLRKDLDEDLLDLGRQFDTVLLVAVIEHVFNQKHLMRQLVPLLKPEGRLVVTSPTPFGNDVVHRIGAALGLFSKDAAHDHVVIYNKRRFLLLAREFGLMLETYCRFQCGCNQLAVFRTAVDEGSPYSPP